MGEATRPGPETGEDGLRCAAGEAESAPAAPGELPGESSAGAEGGPAGAGPSRPATAAGALVSAAWLPVLAGRKALKTADVNAVCERFRELRSDESDDDTLASPFLTADELCGVLELQGGAASLRSLLPLLQVEDPVTPRSGPQYDFRLLLVCLVNLTKAKTLDKMRFALLALDEQSSGQLSLEQFALILHAAALPVALKPLRRAQFLQRARVLFGLALGQGSGDGEPPPSHISHEEVLDLVRLQPQAVALSEDASAAESLPASPSAEPPADLRRVADAAEDLQAGLIHGAPQPEEAPAVARGAPAPRADAAFALLEDAEPDSPASPASPWRPAARRPPGALRPPSAPRPPTAPRPPSSPTAVPSSFRHVAGPPPAPVLAPPPRLLHEKAPPALRADAAFALLEDAEPDSPGSPVSPSGSPKPWRPAAPRPPSTPSEARGAFKTVAGPPPAPSLAPPPRGKKAPSVVLTPLRRAAPPAQTADSAFDVLEAAEPAAEPEAARCAFPGLPLRRDADLPNAGTRQRRSPPPAASSSKELPAAGAPQAYGPPSPLGGASEPAKRKRPAIPRLDLSKVDDMLEREYQQKHGAPRTAAMPALSSDSGGSSDSEGGRGRPSRAPAPQKAKAAPRPPARKARFEAKPQKEVDLEAGLDDSERAQPGRRSKPWYGSEEAISGWTYSRYLVNWQRHVLLDMFRCAPFRGGQSRLLIAGLVLLQMGLMLFYYVESGGAGLDVHHYRKQRSFMDIQMVFATFAVVAGIVTLCYLSAMRNGFVTEARDAAFSMTGMTSPEDMGMATLQQLVTAAGAGADKSSLLTDLMDSGAGVWGPGLKQDSGKKQVGGSDQVSWAQPRRGKPSSGGKAEVGDARAARARNMPSRRASGHRGRVADSKVEAV